MCDQKWKGLDIQPLPRSDLPEYQFQPLPILNILVPQLGQTPCVAGLPFFMVIDLVSFISFLARHLTQYASTVHLPFGMHNRLFLPTMSTVSWIYRKVMTIILLVIAFDIMRCIVYPKDNILVGDCQCGRPTFNTSRSSSDAAGESRDSVQDDPRWGAHRGETRQAVRPISQKRYTGVH